MLPINPSQNTQPSLASYFPRLASSFSDAGVQVHSTAEIYDAVRSVMQINYGLINIPTVGSHNEITVHYHSTGSDAQLLREILRPLQSMAMQPNNAPLASLGIEGLQKKYLESLQKDREIKDALAMYVAPECTLITNTKERFSLEEKVRDFLASKEKKVLLLLGVAGSGKSTFNRYLARSLWEAYDKEANKSGQTPIPLFIRLSSLEKPNTNLISEYLKEEKFTEEQIADLKENYRFIFILDGYDEIKDRTRLFYIENELDEWQAKVIVTSRPEYLGDRYERQFHPKEQPHLLQTYQLAPFSDLTIEEYVNKYKSSYPELEKSVAEHGGILDRPEVKDLIRNPFLLKLSLSELPALAEKYKDSNQRITRLALYDQFVESWFERSQDRLSGIRLTGTEQKAFHFLNKAFTKHGTKFSKDLAIEMYQAGLVRVAYSEQLSYDGSSAEIQDWRDKFLSESNENIKLLRFNAPLVCRDDQYEFAHKSIQDYFVARALWEEFTTIKESAWINKLNIVSDPAILDFLVERVQQERFLIEMLIKWVNASKNNKGFGIAAANALTILVRAKVDLREKDFNGIHAYSADLKYGSFYKTQFKGADLTGCNFQNASLRQAIFRNAKLDRAWFGVCRASDIEVYPMLKAAPVAEMHTLYSLETVIQEFLNNSRKIFLLCGEVDSGKSVFSRNLAESLFKKYITADVPGSMPIPLYIPLWLTSGYPGNLIENYFQQFCHFSPEEIEILRENHRFVFILDGYDELKNRNQMFYVKNRLARWKAKAIITSRPEYLGSNYQIAFQPLGEQTVLEEYRLAPFFDPTAEVYIEKCREIYLQLVKNTLNHRKMLGQFEFNKLLVEAPFLFQMLWRELPMLSQTLRTSGQSFTRIWLYDQFVKNWFDRAKYRLTLINLSNEEKFAFSRLNEEGFVEHGINFSKKFALEMYQAGHVVATYSAEMNWSWKRRSAELSQDWRELLLGDGNEMTRLIRLNAPLIQRGNQHRFIYKSLQDYFVARTLWEEFDVYDKIEVSSWFNRLNIMKDSALLKFLAERVQQKPILKERLLSVVECSKKEAKFETGAANALAIMATETECDLNLRNTVFLRGQDAESIKINNNSVLAFEDNSDKNEVSQKDMIRELILEPLIPNEPIIINDKILDLLRTHLKETPDHCSEFA
ncbi:Uncharacterized protein MCB1EB_0401 [Mycoavidus cysteinexigens]|uniref:Uncharacterized protein n=1 Tax=Mycoavidus cysteinexigens TaxID=1553431 RepID=A0A2Z6ET30_9BURK|nr:NACHT domain-containing protein [Mycoavidus cysteinexigens]BBE08562.1 Uncharacterized protein MCB1EB_0401 [Mycoavidus cysteinexigens]GAM52735.1 hypothetical protein EBME_1198 [bacterium endosymbiont of Mortierella elongata FMR23-6]GLR00413.1 hypothetical protein GCM10007934_02240 [Mycoavidus cysteinexigens]